MCPPVLLPWTCPLRHPGGPQSPLENHWFPFLTKRLWGKLLRTVIKKTPKPGGGTARGNLFWLFYCPLNICMASVRVVMEMSQTLGQTGPKGRYWILHYKWHYNLFPAGEGGVCNVRGTSMLKILPLRDAWCVCCSRRTTATVLRGRFLTHVVWNLRGGQPLCAAEKKELLWWREPVPLINWENKRWWLTLCVWQLRLSCRIQRRTVFPQEHRS